MFNRGEISPLPLYRSSLQKTHPGGNSALKTANKLTTAACKEPLSTAIFFSAFHVIVKYNSSLVISLITDLIRISVFL